LLTRISSRELTEWAVFEREFGPLGQVRGDWQAALVAHTVASTMSSGKDRPKFMDFLLSWAPRRRQTGEEQLQIFKALASGGGES
jgi:hypothetical protein